MLKNKIKKTFAFSKHFRQSSKVSTKIISSKIKNYIQFYDSFYDLDTKSIVSIDEVLTNQNINIFCTEIFSKLEYLSDEEIYRMMDNIDLFELPKYFLMQDFSTDSNMLFNGKRVFYPSIEFVDRIQKIVETKSLSCKISYYCLDYLFINYIVSAEQYKQFSNQLFIFAFFDFIFLIFSDYDGKYIKTFFRYTGDINTVLTEINTFIQNNIDMEIIQSHTFKCFSNIDIVKTYFEKQTIEFIDISKFEFITLNTNDLINNYKIAQFITLDQLISLITANKLKKHLKFYTGLLLILSIFAVSIFINMIKIKTMDNKINTANIQIDRNIKTIESIIKKDNLKFLPIISDAILHDFKDTEMYKSVFDVALTITNLNIRGYTLTGYSFNKLTRVMTVFYLREQIYSIYTEEQFMNQIKNSIGDIKNIRRIDNKINLESNKQILQIDIYFL